MNVRRARPAGRRLARRGATAALVVVAGCGSGGGASKTEYYRSIDTFCGQVAGAAKQVRRDTMAVQGDKSASPARVVKVVTGSLQQFARSTETALNDLEKTNVPKAFASYQDGTSAGFRRFIATLRSTAKAAERDGSGALTRLGPRLNAVKLPDPPQDVIAHAKACASFTPTG